MARAHACREVGVQIAWLSEMGALVDLCSAFGGAMQSSRLAVDPIKGVL